MNPIIISLGNDCTLAIILRELNKRIAAFPFDWLETDISMVPLLFYNRFNDFLNNDNVKKFRKNNWYKSGKGNVDKYFMDTKYNTFHHHDEYNDEVLDKYTRRCLRLINLLESDENIIFIRYKLFEFQDKDNLLKWVHSNRNEHYEIKQHKLYERLSKNIDLDTFYLCELSKVIKNTYKCTNFKIIYYIPIPLYDNKIKYKDMEIFNVFVETYDHDNMKESLKTKINKI